MNFDKQNYLEKLDSEDKLLLEVKNKPNEVTPWINLAKWKIRNRRPDQALDFIKEGCSVWPNEEKLWLMGITLYRNDSEKKIFVRNGLSNMPNSLKLWLEYSTLEKSYRRKQKILEEALTKITNKPLLFLEYIRVLEEFEDFEAVLTTLTEKWGSLMSFWMGVAFFEEKYRAVKDDILDVLVEKIKKGIHVSDHSMDRNHLIKIAESAEKDGFVWTCRAIVNLTLSLDLNAEENTETVTVWLSDAEKCNKRGYLHTTKYIYLYALTEFLDENEIWMRALDFLQENRKSNVAIVSDFLSEAISLFKPLALPDTEKGNFNLDEQRGQVSGLPNVDRVENVNQLAVKNKIRKESYRTPHGGSLWMDRAKLKIREWNLGLAREIGCSCFPRDENLWLLGIKHCENDSAKKILVEEALRNVPRSVKLRIQACALEPTRVEKLAVLREGLRKIRNQPRLWLEYLLLRAKDEELEELRKTLKGKWDYELTIGVAEAFEIEQYGQVPYDSDSYRLRALTDIIQKAVDASADAVDRTDLIKMAETSEEEGFLWTCRAVIDHTLSLDVKAEQKETTKLWLNDAEKTNKRGYLHTTKCIYFYALTTFPDVKETRLKAVEFLQKNISHLAQSSSSRGKENEALSF